MATLLVADSWLVEDSRVRALDLHQQRFTEACAGFGVEVTSFWQDAIARLPRTGEWFPRAELVDTAGQLQLGLQVRPAPERLDTAKVWVSGEPDPRRHPRRKGPDLDRLAELRRAGARHGAQEVLLTGPAGVVLEAANSSLLWWEGEELCLPDPELPVLPGVTVALVLRFAERHGVPVRYRRRRLADLSGREVWLANALHGIRPVTGWIGTDQPVGTPERCARWRQWWLASAHQISV